MQKHALLYLGLLGILLAGCSASLYTKGRQHLRKGEYRPAVEAFYQEINTHPDNAGAWRELGVTYYEMDSLTKAEDALKQASGMQPDARTQLYLGLIYERRNAYDQALDAYAASLALESSGKTATLTRRHLDDLVAKKIEVEAAQAIENESQIDVGSIPDNTVAVVNFDGSGLPPETAPIALGLADFTAADLSKVLQLTVVERAKLDAILRELQLGTTGQVDPATAPRVGRLIGSRRVITGSLLGIGDDALRLDGAIVNVADSTTLRTETAEARLDAIFQAQKQFVFDVIEEMGITLTAAERDAIAEVPTEDYLAFLAYCRGLDYQYRGMFDAAEREFTQAVQLDRGFAAAGQQLQTVRTPATPESYAASQQQFENTVKEESQRRHLGTAGPDQRLADFAHQSGFIPSRPDQADVLVPPEANATTRVIIKGNLDAP